MDDGPRARLFQVALLAGLLISSVDARGLFGSANRISV